jgi:hypothetical protein
LQLVLADGWFALLRPLPQLMAELDKLGGALHITSASRSATAKASVFKTLMVMSLNSMSMRTSRFGRTIRADPVAASVRMIRSGIMARKEARGCSAQTRRHITA